MSAKNASMIVKPRNTLVDPQCGQGGVIDFHRRQFHQPRAGLVDGNRIDYRAARVAFEIGHIATFLDDDATVAVRAGGEFVRDNQVLALVFALGHVAPGGASGTYARELTFPSYGLPARKRHCITVDQFRRVSPMPEVEVKGARSGPRCPFARCGVACRRGGR